MCDCQRAVDIAFLTFRGNVSTGFVSEFRTTAGRSVGTLHLCCTGQLLRPRIRALLSICRASAYI
ncbi:hypothetical protein EYF80_027347 [Liparis tanakae]|uniref:Uncharacterized protein n=1 Tax=Liparis tanakae TaxID=230148 RepID=A0A4Z2H9D5_9TELE|nr:hypothetical protein EYF80_027347 [Liparis tanakae]